VSYARALTFLRIWARCINEIFCAPVAADPIFIFLFVFERFVGVYFLMYSRRIN
jgi:hypothetical protein